MIPVLKKAMYIHTHTHTHTHVYMLFCSVLNVRVFAQTMDCSPPGSSVHGDSAGKNTGVGCHALFQGIFPTQGSSPGLLHCRQADSLLSEPPGKPYTHTHTHTHTYIHTYIYSRKRFRQTAELVTEENSEGHEEVSRGCHRALCSPLVGIVIFDLVEHKEEMLFKFTELPVEETGVL